jgi:hypothetical protein
MRFYFKLHVFCFQQHPTLLGFKGLKTDNDYSIFIFFSDNSNLDV